MWEFGGQRLAISTTGETCITASWKRGAACYKSATGSMVWFRGDLRHAHKLIFSSVSEIVYCVMDGDRVEILQAADGSTISTMRRVQNLFENPQSGELLFCHKRNGYILSNWKSRFPANSFAALDVAFDVDSVCVSESGKAVRCIESASGKEKWTFEPGSGKHALRLAYRKSDNYFYAAIWPYERGGPLTIVRLHPETGESTELFALDFTTAEFCLAGERIVASDGEIIDVSTGAVETKLAVCEDSV
jgi:hypothetical protein